jgi:hypothetical protein
VVKVEEREARRVSVGVVSESARVRAGALENFVFLTPKLYREHRARDRRARPKCARCNHPEMWSTRAHSRVTIVDQNKQKKTRGLDRKCGSRLFFFPRPM